MDFDIPTDLIDKAQIGFREAAGLSTFDRKDTTLPSIPTLESSIPSLDPSPPYLRCKFCQGKLLRDLQSLICIYCGEYQKRDLHPDPISFNSTHGYTWLLQSLNFNGSERIGPLAEGNGINGGPSPAEDELTLFELLNLKISVPEKLENSFNIKASEQNSPLNLDTTDFDNFFTKSKSKSKSKIAIVSEVHEEQPVSNKADQNKIIEDQENLTFDWNAEFQFADTKLENEKPVSVDPFEDVKADPSAHIDAGFGLTKTLDFKKRDNDSDPSQDNLFANMSSSTDWFENTNSMNTIKDDNLFDIEQNAEFQFADTKLENEKAVSVDPFEDVKADPPAHMDAGFGPTETFDFKKSNSDSDPFQDNLFANMSSSTDWFENTNNMNTIKDDNLFDIKPNVSDMIPPEKSNLDNSDWFQNSQWVIGGSSLTTNIMVKKDDNDDDDDGFGEWNDFTTSTGNQDSVKDSIQDPWKESGISEKMPDLQEVDFGNFLQSEVSTGNRNASAEVGNTGEGSKNDEITLDTTMGPKDDVQVLMSQMHDLSFMLKNELSVPSNLDDAGTFHS